MTPRTRSTPSSGARSLSSGVARRKVLKGAGLGLVAAAAGPGLLSACGQGEGSAELGDLTYISFLPFETLSFTPEMMSVAGGHAAEHELDVDVEVARGTSPSLQAMISGAGLVARCATIDLALARTTQDQRLVNIGTIVRGPGQWLNFSSQDPVNSAEDLVDRTIGIPSEGGSTENNLLLMLQNAGVDPDDVERQVVTDNPASWEMIQRGELVGYLSSIDQSLILQNQQEEADAAILGELARVAADTQFFVTTEEHLENHEEQIRAFLAGVRDGMESVLEDGEEKSQTIETMRDEYSFATLDDDDIVAEGINIQADLWLEGDASEVLHTDPDEWIQGIEELEEGGFISGAEDPESWMTNDLLS